MMLFAVGSLEQTDRKVLIAAIIIMTILFILLALLGALIRTITKTFGKQLDNLVHDAVAYRVIDNKKQFAKYAHTKNVRKFVKDATPALGILFVSLIFFIIYGIVTEVWSRPFFEEFSTIFWKWDFGNEENYAVVWGAKILAKWPELTNTPHLVKEYWPSYVLCTLWIIAGVYLLIVGWAFFSREIYVSKRANEVYKKSLEGFNFYDNQPMPGINPNELNKFNEKSGPDQR